MSGESRPADSDSKKDTTTTESSLPQHFATSLRSYAQGHSLPDQLEKACQETTDAHVTITGPQCHGSFPPLPEWQTKCRKAYTLLLWLRVRLVDDKKVVHIDSKQSGDSEKEDDPSKTKKGLWYRFATDDAAFGIEVTGSDWTLESGDDEHNPHGPGTPLLSTNLTATTLGRNNDYASTATCTLQLPVNQWALVAFTHVSPYVKKPLWTCTVNAHVQTGDSSAELSYPVIPANRRKKYEQGLTDNYLLHNLVHDYSSDGKLFHMDVASVALYPATLSLAVLAITAQAGPRAAGEQGRIVPLLPAVANW